MMSKRARHTPARPLTATDAAWYRLEHRGNPVDVTSVLSFDGTLAVDVLCARLEERLLEHPRFRQRVVARWDAAPRWEDEPDFSIARHVSRTRLTPPAGRVELEALVSGLMSDPFDWSRSPWRVVMIEGLAEGTALVVQVHHCMGDGFALMEILLSLADEDPDARVARARASAWPFAGSPRVRDVPRLVLAGARSVAQLARLSFDPPSALRRHPTGHRVASWSRGLPLDRIKDTAHRGRETVNDALLGALTGALRLYLQERGERCPPVRAFVPVNLRPPHAPIDLEHGNWFGLVYVDLPIDVMDHAVRERALHATIARAKRGSDALISLGILELMGRVPLRVARLLEEVFVRKASLVVTNVPGPRERIAIAGVPLREIVFWVPHPRLSLGVSLLSYAGQVHVGVRADSAVVPDPRRLVALFEGELDRMARERGVRPQRIAARPVAASTDAHG
ncbi:Wax ester synthase/acyl-CoA diacylglycerol acyltransferase [Sandaracinus amylolyticus]|uniref:diacylglycerol O-acyltransferase n=2 Tax=Sandaracinus amylolyticus TaxID=927083 RepID=A0A0F6VYV7_9BACT|nr:Wax ester synthase/acyl-CoA diacylglycerol acyltransferase [Sandaracinus amylolyticus]